MLPGWSWPPRRTAGSAKRMWATGMSPSTPAATCSTPTPYAKRGRPTLHAPTSSARWQPPPNWSGQGQALLDAAVDYAKQRAQFGRIIGSYQAIKHKLADVHIALELARPLVYGAALSLADRSPDTARDVSAAKASASDAALLAARSALQTHGAIGFTAEHDLSLWLLRVQALRPAWGDPAAHRRRVLEAL